MKARKESKASAATRRRSPVASNIYRDPDDRPCVAGKYPLWPDGPALPRWAERELEQRGASHDVEADRPGRVRSVYRSTKMFDVYRKEA